jgi:murein DD-endopeptidase MepM/ murein hydrolase activator NlpD
MSSLVEPSRSRAVSRFALLAALSAGVAGCSSDFTRITENPWASKPQASAAQQGSAGSNDVTGSVRQQSAPTHKVDSQPLAAPTYGGGSGMGSYNPPQTTQAKQPPRPEYTGSISAPPPRQPAASASWDGGASVTVAQGETIEMISRRHRVPVDAILQANNMGYGAQPQPGQRLIIPRQAAAPSAAPPQTRVAGPSYSPAAGNAHVVAPGETIYSLARHYRTTPMAIAKANNASLSRQLRVGERVVIPGNGPRVAQQAQPAQPKVQQQVQAQPAPQKVAAVRPEPTPAVKQQAKAQQAEPPASARVITPAADPVPETPTGATGTQSAAAPSFRWPVRGKVITGFGPKASGGQNDGINVSVPEGTPIKAAEDGVVAYAGNELKGYGNLVLVRHLNGFVTAYAHASELSVKKGETIKRGQVIGKAGATGNVTSPQLHFEVRKGATPVDPTQYLNGG